VDGRVRDITAQVGGTLAVNWVSGDLPAGTPAQTIPQLPPIPSGVIEGSRYQPGQQLRVLNPQGLNVRLGPSLDEPIIGALNQGDYVAVLAGPTFFEEIEWWRVRTADGLDGWIAGQIGGAPTLGN
jgi:hypothetical protein